MPITSQHIIRRQYLHVELNGTESDGLALQRSLPGTCQHWVTPAIEKVFKRFSPPDGQHIYIERMEIDVGTLTLDNLEHDLADAVAHALENTLKEQIKPGESSSNTISGNMREKTARLSINEAFIYFLKTGSLPWSFRLPAGSTLEQVILASWQESDKLGADPETFNIAVLNVLIPATVRKRLIRQFSPVFLKALLSALSSEGKKIMDEVLQLLHSSNEIFFDTKHFEQNVYETVFANIVAKKDITPINLIRDAWQALPISEAGNTELTNLLERHWPKITQKDSSTDNPINGKEQQTPNFVEPESSRPAEPKSPPQAGPKPLRYAEAVSSNPAEPESLLKAGPDLIFSKESGSLNKTEAILAELNETEKTSIKLSEHPDIQEGIYIENAGLVLLHPFLPQFFKALGIAEENKLLQPERALCLLHFLTTGQTAAPEYELVLSKILCNIPLLTPVGSDLEPADFEKEEATALLKAVIRHWEALRNTSPDGLRGTFLLRPGKISRRDDNDWLLQVEAKTFDILLDLLPWGISMIKLPWMENILWVEWK